MNPHECVTLSEVVTRESTSRETWPSIITPEHVTKRLLHHAALALRIRPQLPFSATALHGLILLYGPPGTGKTTLARGLPYELAGATRAGVRLIEVNPHGLMSAEHGQSQQHVARLLEEIIPEYAGDAPTVVLIDEIESMAVARAEASLAANPVDVHRATDAVLTALDRSAAEHGNIVWVVTSNFPGALDLAFRSRADVEIEVPLPGAEGVHQILRHALLTLADVYPDLKRLADDRKLRSVADLVDGLDGRRTRKLVYEALAERRETVLDPGLLTIDDLMLAAGRLKDVA